MPLLTLPSHRAKALVFEDPASRALLASLDEIGPTEASVLLSGETGTGKEIAARYLHERSARRAGRFVAVNCGAISESLVESELFGHERGAFTGALGARPGWFETAHGGTLFLDELGELPSTLQVKLLRVLQEREVVRLGARTPIHIDVRLIAATNANLVEDVARGRFRADLYYRIHVAAIALPALRDRPDDILPLARSFAALFGGRRGAAPDIAAAAAARLRAHTWPGNIRELENVMHRAVVASRGGAIEVAHLALATPPGPAAPELATSPVSVAPGTTPAAEPSPEPAPEVPMEALDAALIQLFEHPPANLYACIDEAVIRAAYRYCHRNQLQTARLLAISRNVVRARLIQYGELPSATLRSAERHAAPMRTVRVGYQKFGVLALLKARGAFDRQVRDRGGRVEWIEFPSGSQLVDALAPDKVDLGVVDEGPPILAQAAGAPIVYLAAEPPAPHDTAIVVHADAPYGTVGDLQGKTIALIRGTNVDYLLIRALDEVCLRYEDVQIAAVPPDRARAAFENREVDAWAISNPLLAWVSHAGGARVLRDATGLAPNTTYYIGTRTFADAHPGVVAAFIAEIQATGRWANRNGNRVVDLMATALAMPRPVIAAALARAWFGAQPIVRPMLASQQDVADAFHRVGLIRQSVDVSDARWEPPASGPSEPVDR